MALQYIHGKVNNQNGSLIIAISTDKSNKSKIDDRRRGERCIICYVNKHKPDNTGRAELW